MTKKNSDKDNQPVNKINTSKHQNNSDSKISEDFKNSCAVCSKIFKHRKSLDKHLRGHLSPENIILFQFECDKCNKKFSKKQNMNTHRALIHGILNS